MKGLIISRLFINKKNNQISLVIPKKKLKKGKIPKVVEVKVLKWL
jgi:hypothetical protein